MTHDAEAGEFFALLSSVQPGRTSMLLLSSHWSLVDWVRILALSRTKHVRRKRAPKWFVCVHNKKGPNPGIFNPPT
jgi:hypothetical protein